MMDGSWEWKWVRRLTLLLLILLCGYFIYQLAPWWKGIAEAIIRIALPFIIAGLITYLLHPLIDMTEKAGVHRGLSVFIVYVIFFGGGIGLLLWLGPEISKQWQAFMKEIPTLTSNIQEWLFWVQTRIDLLPTALHDLVEQWIERRQRRFQENVIDVMEHWKLVVEISVLVLLLPFIVFYWLKDLDVFEKTVRYLTPEKWRDEGTLIVRATDEALGSYIRGQVIVSVCVGTLSIIGLWIVGMPFPILLGLFMGITDLIPYFGPALGAIPALLVSATISVKQFIFVLIVITIVQQIESNLLSPIIVGKTVRLHPLMIILALLTGFEIAGMIGLLLAVPLFVVVAGIIRSFRHQQTM